MKKVFTILTVLALLIVPISVESAELAVKFDRYLNNDHTMRFTFDYPNQAGHELIYHAVLHRYTNNGNYHSSSVGWWKANSQRQNNFIRKSTNSHIEVTFKYVPKGASFEDSPIFATVHLYPNDINPIIIFGDGEQ